VRGKAASQAVAVRARGAERGAVGSVVGTWVAVAAVAVTETVVECWVGVTVAEATAPRSSLRRRP